jgi:hypothetical protein
MNRDGITGRPRPDFADRFALFFSRGRRIDGLWIGGFMVESPVAFQRVIDALSLIKTHDPINYGRVTRELDRVWITLLPASRGSYNFSLNACQIDERFVLGETTSSALIASVIVHEATHARLMRCGIGYEEELRIRVERVCVRRQRAFAAKLPGGDEARQQAERFLTDTPSTEFWSNKAFAARIVEGYVKGLREAGAPSWVIKAVLGARELRLAVRRVLRHLRRRLGHG